MTKFNILSITTAIAIALSSITAFAISPSINMQEDSDEESITGQHLDSAQNEEINQAMNQEAKNGTVLRIEDNIVENDTAEYGWMNTTKRNDNINDMNQENNQYVESHPQQVFTDTQKELQQDPELNEMAENKAETTMEANSVQVNKAEKYINE